MLGENHSLLCDFPEHEDTINSLNATSTDFAEKAKRYHSLDDEIRNLEELGSPASDETLHQLKHDRAELKDELYQVLINVK
ncbi:MAG TPA: hypothetical protein DD453_04860 [Alteromonas macleodii]|nr:YdcH family protein [Alteromonas macleodii]MAL70977.1 hypothetical protein [Alteromonas sp.]MAW04416.1 hypothetical protein [Alteromonas sp.]HAD90728.1 hypothetical protein [Alteromonas macleodii]HBN98659.1 hypothetical protein [Alteromonas macleodii]HCS81167.1 hypothetical protein [Alteromonas macleodii]|tara:strand:- start:171 stop:413 length:243 start_codon:yes stop_codon:yes gene_type:complete